jgi:hypothetical protein
MAHLIEKPTVIEAAGKPAKSIEEFIGRVNSETAAVSIARMKSRCSLNGRLSPPRAGRSAILLGPNRRY